MVKAQHDMGDADSPYSKIVTRSSTQGVRGARMMHVGVPGSASSTVHAGDASIIDDGTTRQDISGGVGCCSARLSYSIMLVCTFDMGACLAAMMVSASPLSGGPESLVMDQGTGRCVYGSMFVILERALLVCVCVA